MSDLGGCVSVLPRLDSLVDICQKIVSFHAVCALDFVESGGGFIDHRTNAKVANVVIAAVTDKNVIEIAQTDRAVVFVIVCI